MVSNVSCCFHTLFTMIHLALHMQTAVLTVTRSSNIPPSKKVSSHPFSPQPSPLCKDGFRQLFPAVSLMLGCLLSLTSSLQVDCVNYLLHLECVCSSAHNRLWEHHITLVLLLIITLKANLFCKVISVFAWNCLSVAWNPFCVTLERVCTCHVRLSSSIPFFNARRRGVRKLWIAQPASTAVVAPTHLLSFWFLLILAQYFASLGLFLPVKGLIL